MVAAGLVLPAGAWRYAVGGKFGKFDVVGVSRRSAGGGLGDADLSCLVSQERAFDHGEDGALFVGVEVVEGFHARLDVETPTRLVQATIWDSGEVDLVVGDLASGDVLVNEHREVSAQLGVRTLLEDVFESIDG